MTNIRTRLGKLENRVAAGCIIVWRNFGETDEQAKSRWKAEHPGQADELDGARTVYIMGWDYEGEVKP